MRDNAVTHSLSRLVVVSPQRVCVVMSCVCSAVSGVVSATLGTPADVVKSRMMSQ